MLYILFSACQMGCLKKWQFCPLYMHSLKNSWVPTSLLGLFIGAFLRLFLVSPLGVPWSCCVFLTPSVFSPPALPASCVGQNSAAQPHPDDAEQQAALLLACSGDTLPAPLPPVNMHDLLEALQVTAPEVSWGDGWHAGELAHFRPFVSQFGLFTV